MQTVIFLLLFTIVFPLSCYAQLPKKELTQFIKNNMQTYHIPGVSIAVIKDYRIEWIAGFGIADKIHQQPVTTDTLFQAGSISKPVTAMAALRAVKDQKITLEKNINQYLRSWQLPENKWTAIQPVTLRELLNHSAGITVHGFVGYAKNQPLPSLIEVLNGVPPANSAPIRVSAIPGSNFNYSGGGYTIIQQALMDVYHQFLKNSCIHWYYSHY
ncbi:MAG: beta-lactamase family protein [Proteobacteria bacterium]|nr:beta-lactamase family protein [Pseudomonadota bacterium]